MRTPTAEERAEWAGALGDAALHARLLGELECLLGTEGDPEGGDDVALHGWVRVAAWNVQRGRRPAALAALLRSCAADIALVSEVDSGMARTGNADVPAVLAQALGCAYAYGVEFVELGPGDEIERVEAAGSPNIRGLHGNAVLARARLCNPEVVRLSDGGALWFDENSTQPRVGGRLAVVATVGIGGQSVDVASVHLENRVDPASRAEEMEVLLRALDARSGEGPVVIGGDLNTLSVPVTELTDRDRVHALRATEPARFTWPVAHEPLFEVAADYGYSWTDANVAAPTTSHDEAGRPGHVPLRLDWLLCAASRPVALRSSRRPRVRPPRRHRQRAFPTDMSPSVLRVRASGQHDEEAILDVVRDAFGAGGRDPAEEVGIVRETWFHRSGPRRLELVADDDGLVVGHVLAATGDLAGHEMPAVAPLGVATHRQRDGVGTALMAHLLDEAAARGWSLLLLLGDPEYYARFGFVPAANFGIHYAPAGVGSPHFLAHNSGAATAEVPRGEFRYCWEL